MAENLDLGMKCIQYMLCISNFMFVVIGILMIVIGSSVITIYNNFEVFLENHHFSPATLIISIGVIICVVALFGCIGALKKSTMLINFYTLLLSFLFILEITAIIVAYAKRNTISGAIEESMFDSLKEYNNVTDITESWDFVQDRLSCCGVHGYKDWSDCNLTENFVDTGNFTVPRSCCVTTNCTHVFGNGCLDQVAYIISESAFMLGTGGVCVALVQILGIIFGHMLAKTIRKMKTKEEMVKQQQRQVLYNLHNENYSIKNTSKA